MPKDDVLILTPVDNSFWVALESCPIGQEHDMPELQMLYDELRTQSIVAADGKQRKLLIPLETGLNGANLRWSLVWLRLNAASGPLFGFNEVAGVSKSKVPLFLRIIFRSMWRSMSSRELAGPLVQQHVSVSVPEQIADFLHVRLALRSENTPRSEVAAAHLLLDSKTLFLRTAEASHSARMPSVDGPQLRAELVQQLEFNPPSDFAGSCNPPEYIVKMAKDRVHGGNIEIQAFANRFDCPVVILEAPGAVGELQFHSVHGRDTQGLPIMLIILNAGTVSAHYCLAIFSGIPQFESELDAARRIVHVEPISAYLRLPTGPQELKLFGMPALGNCLFSALALALQSRQTKWQKGGTECKSFMQRIVQSSAAKAFAEEAKGLRPHISQTDNNMLSLSSHASLAVICDQLGVGLNQPTTVMMDPSSGY